MAEKAITFLGLGGEGAKTASSLFARAAFEQGNQSQASPQFGAERRNAPVKSFARVSDQKIWERGQIVKADIVIVLNTTLFEKIDVLFGLKESGLLIVNSRAGSAIDLIVNSRNEFSIDVKAKMARVVFVDATGIAMKHIKKPIPSTAILGALAKHIDPKIVDMDHLCAVIREQFGEGNVKAAEECYKVA